MELYNIKEIIYKKHRLAHCISKMNIRLPQPLYLLVYLTLGCRSNCAWCFQKNDLFYKRGPSLMSPKDFRMILSSLKKEFLFKPHIHFFGGEPLSHPEFSDFVNISRELGFYPSITTNSDYLKDNIEIINNSTIRQLNVSLNKQSVENLEDSYGGLVSQIESLREKDGKLINLNYFLNPSGYYLLEDIVMFLNKRIKKGMVSTFGCQHFIFENNEDTIKENKKIDLGAMTMQITRLKSKSLNFKLLFFPDIRLEDLGRYYTSDFLFRNECYVPWTGLSVYPELSVVLGGGVLGCNKIVGDLKSQSWRRIWRGEESSNLRNNLLTRGLPKECFRCCHKLYY